MNLGLKKPLSIHFGRAKYFTIVRLSKNKITSIRTLKNPYIKVERKSTFEKFLIGANIAEMLHKNGVTDVVTINIGEIAFSILLRHNILLWMGKEGVTVKELIEDFINDNLVRLKKPTHEEAWKKYSTH